MCTQDYTITKPLKTKTYNIHSSVGRNNKGHITAWHRGGGHRRLFRDIDFHRDETNGIVIRLEYDPNRTANIARVYDPDRGQNNYILASSMLKPGSVIRSKSEIGETGHSQELRYIATGALIYNISLKAGQPGKFLRAGGSFGILIKKTDKKAQVQLKSGLTRWFPIDAIATLGTAGNSSLRYKRLRKAGQNRWLGKRPSVRGVAMNPIDHPHGGGEGKTSGGRPSVTPWGKPTRGKPTSKKRK